MKTTNLFYLVFCIMLLTACNTSKKDNKNTDSKDTNQIEQQIDTVASQELNNLKNNFSAIDHYLAVKDALVADDQESASISGKEISMAFQDFKIEGLSDEREEELLALIVKIEEQGQQISQSTIEDQRQILATLSGDMMDLIAITGTPKKLYQQYCPMFDNNKGGIWLSDSKEIRNPLFGSKMLKCGVVQKELN